MRENRCEHTIIWLQGSNADCAAHDRFRDELVRSLRRQRDQQDHLRRERDELHSKKTEATRSLADVAPQLQALVRTTKRLQREVETLLPTFYKGRPVHLVGEINAIVAP